MRIHGLPHYGERMVLYLSGDRTQVVSQPFADAVGAIGIGEVQLKLLTPYEKSAMAGLDLRWQLGPDGVLLWTSAAWDQIDPQYSPDFKWLFEAAKEVLNSNSVACMSKTIREQQHEPAWLVHWVDVWANWAYRFVSIGFDSALAVARK